MKNKIIVKLLVFGTILLFGGSIIPCIEANENFVKNEVPINNNENKLERSQGIPSIYFVSVLIDYLPDNCYDYKFGLPLFHMPKTIVSDFILNTYEGQGTVRITKIGGPTQEYNWPTECSFLTIKTFVGFGLFIGRGFAFYETSNGNALSIEGFAIDVTCF